MSKITSGSAVARVQDYIAAPGSADIVDRLRGPGIEDYELDLGVARDAASEIEILRARLAECHKTHKMLIKDLWRGQPPAASDPAPALPTAGGCIPGAGGVV
jgi:hypothetical protein